MAPAAKKTKKTTTKKKTTTVKKKAARRPAAKKKASRAAAPKATGGTSSDKPLRPDDFTAGPKRELKLPITPSTKAPIRPIQVRRAGWTEREMPKRG